MKPEEYTYDWLVKNGYKREAPDKYRGKGFVRYIKGHNITGGSGYYEDEVVFCGNNAVMEKHAEGVWKTNFPEFYKWWTTPDLNKRIRTDNGFGEIWTPINGFFLGYPKKNTFIKGEDPYLMRAVEKE